MRGRIHAAPASSGAAETWSIVFAIKQVVVVGELLACFHIPACDHPDVPRDDVSFTIWLAGMINERCHSETIDHMLSAIEAEQIRLGKIIIKIVSMIVCKLLPNVLDHKRPLANGFGGVATP